MTDSAIKDDSHIYSELTASQYTSDNDDELETTAASFQDTDLHSADLKEWILREKLKFFFMNPIQKWQAKRRFPYKFLVQVIKLFLATIQLCLFAHSRSVHVSYMWGTKVTFCHLFLLGWDASREVNEYPPASGPMALYKISEFYSAVDYAIRGYGSIDQAIGPYMYTGENNEMMPMQLCISQDKEDITFHYNESYSFNSEVLQTCMLLNLTRNDTVKFSSKEYLVENGVNIQFSAIIEATLSFSIKTINFKSAGLTTPPHCYIFNVTILFDNKDQDGQMKYSLSTEAIHTRCRSSMEYRTSSNLNSTLQGILNSFLILICSLSLFLCSRAIYRAQRLKFETIDFFKKTLNKDVSFEGKLEFLNFWYLIIIVNDIMIILGAAIKLQIEKKQLSGDEWNFCSVLLGTGNMLVWFGVLRYLSFFKAYNVVILTLKKAAPNLLRFLLCALLLYAGFAFCGWLVLGPYHMKFRSLSITSECLFALINGDDMFATFSTMEAEESALLWWYSRIYLYTFICLYVYVVLSLFITVIINAYDTIEFYYKKGFPKNDIQLFVSKSTHYNTTMPFRSDSFPSGNLPQDLCQ